VDIDWQASDPAAADDPTAEATGPTSTHGAEDHGARPPGVPEGDRDDTLVDIAWQEAAEAPRRCPRPASSAGPKAAV
jgi:hypothetical protein